MLHFKPLVHAILEDYALPWHDTHGVSHWARVLENGLRLAQKTRATIEVVQLFAVFHDSRRVNEGVDDGHGKRGAKLTEAAKQPDILKWADGRGCFEIVTDEWGIDLRD
jgi:uncharacterized protein